MSEQFSNEEIIHARRRQRIEEMQRSKEKQLRRRKYFKMIAPLAAGAFSVVVLVLAGVTLVGQINDKAREQERALPEVEDGKEYASIAQSQQTEVEEAAANDAVAGMENTSDIKGSNTTEALKEEVSGLPVAEVPEEVVQSPVYVAEATRDTLNLGEEIVSNYALLIDLESDEILAQKAAKQIINPASMTKILTVLVAAEHVTDLDDTFTMTIEITDYSFVNDCSNAGFLDGEVITVRDLFYGTVLPSGGDAAVGLATYVAGSQEEFVKLMNDKLEELGLSETAHVTNCVGLYDEDHYCTVYDMAMILEAAIENDLCREVLSAHTYTTSVTEQHPEGILLSNWFLRRIEDKDTGGVVMCGKTGYVVESGNCAASYAVDEAGKGYICVTADATSSWRCIYDHVALYKQFATEDKEDKAESLSAAGNVETG
ncbi:MAG: D-alanyl-D-alanine carboxypeptidase [Lachnospiraceae bacterium]|nr:D-alanyl-D-alanine carboxypeptidase [Lachnospiraceae bacterium]